MDRDRFVLSAPRYYALAICLFFTENQSSQSQDIIESFSYTDKFELNTYERLRDNRLFREALQLVVSHGLIEMVEDDFGPTILIKGEYAEGWDALSTAHPDVFGKYLKLGKGGRRWLNTALEKLNSIYDELGIEDEDFDEPDREWTPLQLDRSDPKLEEAIKQIDLTINQVESDNGYAVHVPEERAYVIDTLTKSSERLRLDRHISIGYLSRNALDPLLRLTQRFAGAAIGTSSNAAAKALIDFIQTSVGSVVTHALRRLFGFE